MAKKSGNGKKIKRDALIGLLVGAANATVESVNAGLAARDYAPLTEAEKVQHLLVCPAAVDVTGAKVEQGKKPKATKKAPANLGPQVGVFEGQPVFAANAMTVNLVGALSKTLQSVDPEAWAHYKAMKAPGTIEAKKAAYAWAFTQLLDLAYIPTGV